MTLIQHIYFVKKKKKKTFQLFCYRPIKCYIVSTLKQQLTLFQPYFNFEGQLCAKYDCKKSLYCWPQKQTEHKSELN